MNTKLIAAVVLAAGTALAQEGNVGGHRGPADGTAPRVRMAEGRANRSRGPAQSFEGYGPRAAEGTLPFAQPPREGRGRNGFEGPRDEAPVDVEPEGRRGRNPEGRRGTGGQRRMGNGPVERPEWTGPVAS